MTAQNLYGTFCFSCHDTNGKGIQAMRGPMPELPDFTAAAWQKSRADADLSHSILEGKGKFMLPMKDKLGNVDVKQMVALVRGFEGGKQIVELEAPKSPGPALPAPASPESAVGPRPMTPTVISDNSAEKIRVGSTIFRQYCIVCHGPDGTGSIMRASMPVIPDFTKATFHESRGDAQIERSILDGKGTLMPANQGRVTVAQAEALVAYVRAFAPIGTSIPTGGPVSDSEFDRSFQQLQRQWEELQKQLQKAKEKK
jgi:mono/diheme cytochrome c family protein